VTPNAAIIRLHDLPLGEIAHLVAASEAEGYRFLRRLVDEWQSGANRFSRPGEALFAAVVGGQITGVCGLNKDPYLAEERAGRVRHLYVQAESRRHGIGRRLVGEVVEQARGNFDTLCLWTNEPPAARFYEALGFRPYAGISTRTHLLELIG